MEMREEHGVEGVVHHQAEAALGCEIAELHVEGVLRKRALELLYVFVGIAAFPGVEYLKIRPVVLWQHCAVLCLELTQLLSPLRVRMHTSLKFGAYLRSDLEFLGYGTVFDVGHIFIKILIHIVLKLDYSRWVGGDDDADVLLDSHAHKYVVP